MSGLRDVSIVMSSKRTGDRYLAKSYPHEILDNNGRTKLFSVPVFWLYLHGTDDKNAPVQKDWKALRFMPYWNDPKKSSSYRTLGWANAGLRHLPKKTVTYYNPIYMTRNRTSPFSGAIQMRDSFLIHAGPQTIHDSGWGAAGCVEIIGDFGQFREDIKILSGSTKVCSHDAILELVSAKKLFIQVDHAIAPNIPNENNFQIP
ncbi:UNVERIFIED_CONTAM: hypothetical protein Cloal_3513 [Acetivibrio alkalicellulosi]